MYPRSEADSLFKEILSSLLTGGVVAGVLGGIYIWATNPSQPSVTRSFSECVTAGNTPWGSASEAVKLLKEIHGIDLGINLQHNISDQANKIRLPVDVTDLKVCVDVSVVNGKPVSVDTYPWRPNK